MKKSTLYGYAANITFVAIFAAAMFAAASCSSKYKAVYREHPPIIDRPNYAIFEETIDGHEYLILDGSYSGGIVHKTTCPNHE